MTTHPVLAIAVAAVVVGGGFEALVAVTGIGGQQLETIADRYVYTALELIAVAVCAARVVRRREDRVAWALMTGALIAWTGGDLVWTVWLDGMANPPYPSIADVLYLAMYPAVYVAMMLLIRSRLRNAGAAQWLDGAVTGLTIASVGAALVFGSVLTTSSAQPGAEIVSVAYLVGDFVLLIFVAVAYSLAGWRPGRAWLLFGAGVTLMAAADIIFSYQTATSTYVPGTPLDVLWPLSMALLALAAWMPIGRPGHDQVDAPHTIALTPLAATCALALLVAAGLAPICPLSVALAGAALVLAGVRGAMTYLENVRILRRNAREASTDPLSGLGNRRRLMGDLELAFAAARSEDGSTLLFFDLNGFKRYNDMFGHAAGDALLARIGARLRAAIGDNGSAYRLGGDEFCVLLDGRLPRTDPLVAAATQALFERGSGFALTSSVGTAILPDDAAGPSAALALADERMYADKAGRSSSSRAQTRDTQRQLLSERAHGLGGASGGVGTLVAVVASRLAAGRRGAGCGAAGGRAARHRQARDPGRDPQQGGAAERVRMALHAPASTDRGTDRRRGAGAAPGRAARPLHARALGREGLPRRHLRGRDPARGADRRGLRRLRGDDVAPSVPERAHRRRGDRRVAPGRRLAI